MDKINQNKNNNSQLHHTSHYTYLLVIGLIFVAFTVVFLFFPRTTFSETEKRTLATFPEVNEYVDRPADLTAAISQWFSDSEPYREQFMTLSNAIRGVMRFQYGGDGDAISYHAMEGTDNGLDETTDDDPLDPSGNPLADAEAKKTASGMFVVGTGPNVRAFQAFRAGPESAKRYVEALNAYADAFPGVNIYGIVAPNASEFYLPDKVKDAAKSQKAVYDYIEANVSPSVKFVYDVYRQLAAHTNEDIFLRTDHHWAPLAGYYATKALAAKAGVNFKDISSYQKKVIKGFVGSMYGYSKDIAVKNAPEDFVYYMPDSTSLRYTTTYIDIKTDKDKSVTGEEPPRKGEYFIHHKDGSSGAYSTFMGGDRHIVQVRTNTPGNRKLVIIKDSHGNVLPGYLMHSFSEIHVLDFRYFPRDLKEYVKENGITDIALAFGIFNACTPGTMKRITEWVTPSKE